MSERPIRVLHVDDDPSVLDLTADMLEAEGGLSVETATSASEGLDRLAEGDVDCVVSDYEMPGLDGIEFLSTVRADHPDLPFVLFTGKGSEDVASEAISEGVTDYLQKQVGAEQYELLANRVRNAVSQYRATRRTGELERIRRVLRAVNQALLRAGSRAEIERRVCETLSEAEPYRFAWVGEHDAEAERVRPRAAAGVEEGYLDAIEITTDGAETAGGPTGRAVLTGELAVMQNIPEDPAFEPWREDALERGYQSSAAVPLVYDETCYGVLSVYADRTDAFDEQERRLLAELADDVAHAIGRAEARARGERYERIIENLPVGVYRARPGPEGELLEANPALAEIFGVDDPSSTSELMASEFYRDLEASEAFGEELEAEGLVEGVELELETADGEPRWIEITAMATEADGEVVVDGILLDVTERTEHEHALEELQAATRELMAATSVEAVASVAAETAADVLDFPLCGVHRYDPGADAMVPVAWTDRADLVIGEEPPSIPAGEGLIWAAYETGEPRIYGDVREAEDVLDETTAFRSEMHFPLGDHGVLLVGSEAVEDFDETDEALGRMLAAAVEAAWDRVQREEELARRGERLRALFENSPDAITVHDAEGEVIDVNRQMVENLGYAREELESMTVDDFEVGAEIAELRERWAAMDVGERHQAEGTHRRKDGSTFPIEMWVNKVELDGEDRYVALGRDVTDRRASERALERQNERLEELVGVISHDLRSPLTVAAGRVELARREHDSEDLKTAEDALDRVSDLLDGLLTLAREGRRIEETEPVELASVVERCWENVMTGEATLVVETGRTIRADPSRLAQLLENLVRNAVEHGGEAVTVTVEDLEDGFAVEDDGAGVPPERREEVFESGVSTGESGTGFGLAIVEEIADAHGWDVALTEGASGGARFEVTGVEVVG